MMPVLQSVATVAATCVMGLYAAAAFSQPYPNKPLRIIGPEPGGAADFVARLVGQGLSLSFGQQVIVENQGSASGTIAAQMVAKAQPNGYTLLIYGSTVWTVPLMQDTPYDPVKDLAPITFAARSPNVLVVHPSLPVNSVPELVTAAKAAPGKLNYATGGTGSTPHLAAELLKSMAGINIVRINYKGSTPALNGLLSAEVHLMFAIAAAAMPHVKPGRLRALAVTSAQPSPLVPGLPTVAASGLPGYESGTTIGVFAPAGTPAALINLMNQEMARVLEKPDTKEKCFNVGMETVGSSPEVFAALVKSDIAKWGKVIRDAGIRAE